MLNIFIPIRQNEEGAELLIEDKELLTLLDQNFGAKIQEKWKSHKAKWYTENGNTIYDFSFLLGYIPICSQKVYEKMKDIHLVDVEFLPISIENEPFYIINPCFSVSDILNKKRSKIDYFSDGQIMWISEYVFYPTEIKSGMFKIPEAFNTFFVTEEFVNFVKAHQFNGFEFKKCAIKEKSFLSKFLKSQ